MRLGRHVVHILAAAIALIAAYLVPSAAEAHAGHHHSEPAVAAVQVASPEQSRSADLLDLAEVEEAAVVTLRSDAVRRAKGCSGFCCGTGTTCCAHALTAEAGALTPARSATRIARPSEFALRPGVDPEALPKPPRTIARS